MSHEDSEEDPLTDDEEEKCPLSVSEMTIPKRKINGILKKNLSSFLEEEKDPYLFGVETTTKKRKTAMAEPGQKNIKDFFAKINK